MHQILTHYVQLKVEAIYVCKNFSNEEILEKIISASPNYCCIGEFGIITEYSLEKCNRNCEEYWNSKVEKLL